MSCSKSGEMPSPFVDELYMLTQVSGSDQSKERTPVGVPQQQPVGADDDGIQVAHTNLVKSKGYPNDCVTHEVDKSLELKNGECSASKHFSQHLLNCFDGSLRHAVGGVISRRDHCDPDPPCWYSLWSLSVKSTCENFSKVT